MLRNLSFAVILGVVTGAVWYALSGSTPLTGAAEPKAGPNFVHTVIFYLKKDAPAGEIDAVITDAHKMLAKIPSVRELKCGRPAEKTTPGFGVKDYQVGLLVLFDNDAGLKAYDEHPLHKEYVQKHLPHIEKVVVYDFENKPAN
jgi:uncharacterized membrane protein